MAEDRRDTGRIDLSRRGLLRGVAATGGLAFAGTATGGPGRGPPDGGDDGRGPPGTKGCDLVVPDDHSTIQAAVDAADPGDSVCVKDGTYVEQVVVGKSLTLEAAGDASPTIRAPASPDAFTVPESGSAWEPVVFAHGGEESGGDVTGAGTVDVTVSGLTVDGDGRTDPVGQRGVGVLARNVVGDVRDNEVENMGVGGRETFGVVGLGDSTLTVAGNDVNGYERGGIGVNGDGGDHPAPSVDVIDNAVTGSTGIGTSWAPNGIQVGFGAEGSIRDNVVADNRWNDSLSGDIAAGIIVFASSGVTVQRNEVTNSDVGLATASAGNNRFVGNDVTDALLGAFLFAVDNNKLVNNALANEDLGDVAADTSTIGVLNTGDNNKLIRNTIEGFDVDIQNAGTDAKVHANET